MTLLKAESLKSNYIDPQLYKSKTKHASGEEQLEQLKKVKEKNLRKTRLSWARPFFLWSNVLCRAAVCDTVGHVISCKNIYCMNESKPILTIKI